jgi:hypothetical protein
MLPGGVYGNNSRFFDIGSTIHPSIPDGFAKRRAAGNFVVHTHPGLEGLYYFDCELYHFDRKSY